MRHRGPEEADANEPKAEEASSPLPEDVGVNSPDPEAEEANLSDPEGEGPNLEWRLRRLEEIVGTLERDDLELDRALELFEEGVGHVKAAETALGAAELKVEQLLGEADALMTESLQEGEK